MWAAGFQGDTQMELALIAALAICWIGYRVVCGQHDYMASHYRLKGNHDMARYHQSRSGRHRPRHIPPNLPHPIKGH